MKKYRLKNPILEAVQLIVDNMEEVEKWCNGSIRGTRLPIEQRDIKIWLADSEEEVYVGIGDWIVKGNDLFAAYNTKTFNNLFEEIK